MKLNGFVGKGSGKLGSSVFAISGGEQIVRQYNPVVSNPQTDAQVEQRAKLKLLSQVAAALAPAIAIPKQGLKSSRNLFIKKNYPFVTYTENEAKIALDAIQLTMSSLYIPDVDAVRGEGNKANVNLNAAASSTFDKVVYVAVEATDDDKLFILGSAIAEPGVDGEFSAEVPVSDHDIYIYAYGIKFANASAAITFEDYAVEEGSTDAVLGVVNKMAASGNTLSITGHGYLASL